MKEASKIGGVTAKRLPPNAGKGRPKGAKNKATVAVKEAMQAVYADLQDTPLDGVEAGPHAHFRWWASNNATEFYKLWAKLLPTEISGPDGAPVGLRITEEVAALPKERRDAIRAVLAGMGSK